MFTMMVYRTAQYKIISHRYHVSARTKPSFLRFRIASRFCILPAPLAPYARGPCFPGFTLSRFYPFRFCRTMCWFSAYYVKSEASCQRQGSTRSSCMKTCRSASTVDRLQAASCSTILHVSSHHYQFTTMQKYGIKALLRMHAKFITRTLVSHLDLYDFRPRCGFLA